MVGMATMDIRRNNEANIYRYAMGECKRTRVQLVVKRHGQPPTGAKLAMNVIR